MANCVGILVGILNLCGVSLGSSCNLWDKALAMFVQCYFTYSLWPIPACRLQPFVTDTSMYTAVATPFSCWAMFGSACVIAAFVLMIFKKYCMAKPFSKVTQMFYLP